MKVIRPREESLFMLLILSDYTEIVNENANFRPFPRERGTFKLICYNIIRVKERR